MDTVSFERVCDGFQKFHAFFAASFGRKQWREHSRNYLQALLVQAQERRNAENLPESVGISARAMQRFLTEARWSDDAVIGRLQEYLAPRLGHPEAVWVFDGSDFPKQGRKSAGVARQYCGRLGKVANSQAGMFLACVSPPSASSGPALVDKRLYLPGSWTSDPGRCAAAGVEFASGLVGRALAVADVSPELAARLLTPSVLMDIGRRLVLTGNYVAAIEVSQGQIELRIARQWQIVRGGVDESSWVYELELAAPSGSVTKRVQSAGVVHCRINVDSREPWLGTSPLLSAGISAELLVRLESKTNDEMKAPVGSVLPIPEGMSEENYGRLISDLASLKGDISLVETAANGMGQGRQSAPQIEWQPKRLGANIPESHIALREQVGRDVCAALGIPSGLYSGTDGGGLRESYRQLLTATLEPYASLIKGEFDEKIGYGVTLDFKKLAAADIAARARAYGTLVASGVDKEDAAEVSGLTL